MQGFRDVLDECGFMDLGFVGPMFTWHKHFETYTVCIGEVRQGCGN